MKYSNKEREKIIRYYLENGENMYQTSLKFGIKGHMTLDNWLKKLQIPKKSSTFAAGIKPQMADEEPMKKQTPEELEAEVKRLTKELEWSKLQNKALNTLIDIAESQGIRIRKKSGAKR